MTEAPVAEKPVKPAVEKPVKATKEKAQLKIGTIISNALNRGVQTTEAILKDVQKVHPSADISKVRRQIYSRRWSYGKNRKASTAARKRKRK